MFETYSNNLAAELIPEAADSPEAAEEGICWKIYMDDSQSLNRRVR